MKYDLAVKLSSGTVLYTVAGPYDTMKEARKYQKIYQAIWEDTLDEDESIAIVPHQEE